MKPRTIAELEAGLEAIRRSPADHGRVEMIVRRPRVGQREMLNVGELDIVNGLIGDNWPTRDSSRSPDRAPHPEKQLTIMNARVIALLEESRERWPLTGDQLFVDLDLSEANMRPGTRLQLGSAIIEITAWPHTGCHKFSERFGVNATRFVNSPVGTALRLRGLNAKVVQSGLVQVGDLVTKVETDHQ
jgi:MOSC domain-containing protein YiiM